jgi:hypothetical protein
MARKQASPPDITNTTPDTLPATENVLPATELLPQPVALSYTGELLGFVLPVARSYVSEGWSIAVGERDDPEAGIITKETATLIAENQPAYFTLKYEA